MSGAFPGVGFIGAQFGAALSAVVLTLAWLGSLAIARLIVRRSGAAWLLFTMLFVSWSFVSGLANRPSTVPAWLLLVLYVVYTLMFVWLLWKHGPLGLSIGLLVNDLVGGCLWTLDMSRWYAWRQWIVVAIPAAIAFWGFRNVRGKQSAFPAGALDG